MRLEGNVTVLQGPALRGDTRTHALSSYFLTPVSVALGGGAFFPLDIWVRVAYGREKMETKVKQ